MQYLVAKNNKNKLEAARSASFLVDQIKILDNGVRLYLIDELGFKTDVAYSSIDKVKKEWIVCNSINNLLEVLKRDQRDDGK